MNFISKAMFGAPAGGAPKGGNQARPQPQQAPYNPAHDPAEQIVKYDQEIKFKEQNIEEYYRKAIACKSKGDMEGAASFLNMRKAAMKDRTSSMARRANLFQMQQAVDNARKDAEYAAVINTNKSQLKHALDFVNPEKLEEDMDELSEMFDTSVEVSNILNKSLVTETAADKEEMDNLLASLPTDESQAMGNAYGSAMHQQPQYQQQNVYAGAGMRPQQQQPQQQQQQQRQQQVAMPASSSSSAATILMPEPPSWTPASMAMPLPPSGSSSTTTTSTATIRQPIASMADALGGLE